MATVGKLQLVNMASRVHLHFETARAWNNHLPGTTVEDHLHLSQGFVAQEWRKHAVYITKCAAN